MRGRGDAVAQTNLQAEQKVRGIYVVYDPGLECGLSHLLLVLLAPERWNGDDPPDFGGHHLSDLLLELLKCLLRNVPQSLLQHH